MISRKLIGLLCAATLIVATMAANQAQPQGKADVNKKKNQEREEKLEMLLTDLLTSCKKTLTMQIDLQNGIKNIQRNIEANSDKKPSPRDRAAALKLADNMKDIIAQTNKSIKILEDEGTAVAFPEVFQQVRGDMKKLQSRLEKGDVGKATQDLGEDIIDTYREMVGAFKSR